MEPKNGLGDFHDQAFRRVNDLNGHKIPNRVFPSSTGIIERYRPAAPKIALSDGFAGVLTGDFQNASNIFCHFGPSNHDVDAQRMRFIRRKRSTGGYEST